jgi:hypothetical protein
MRLLSIAILFLMLMSIFIPIFNEVGFNPSSSGIGNLIKKFVVRCDDGSLVDYDGTVSGYLYNDIGYNETFTVQIEDGRGRVVFCPLEGGMNYTLVYVWEGITREEVIFVEAGEGDDCGYVNTTITNRLHPTEDRKYNPTALSVE